VQVKNIRGAVRLKRASYGGYINVEATVYDVVNLITQRKTTFRSAAKFRGGAVQVAGRWVTREQRDLFAKRLGEINAQRAALQNVAELHEKY
jgi:hypothetical protein